MLQFSQIQERLFAAAILEVEKRQVKQYSNFSLVCGNVIFETVLEQIKVDNRDVPAEYKSQIMCH